MKLRSIEKLRKTLAASMDTWFKRELVCIADEIETEIAERYMELPLDADGVPIRIGDKVDDGTGGGPIEVMSLTYFEDCCDVNACGMNPRLLRHVNPRTVEDVLSAYYTEVSNHLGKGIMGEITAKYAAEIRELMGGDA